MKHGSSHGRDDRPARASTVRIPPVRGPRPSLSSFTRVGIPRKRTRAGVRGEGGSAVSRSAGESATPSAFGVRDRLRSRHMAGMIHRTASPFPSSGAMGVLLGLGFMGAGAVHGFLSPTATTPIPQHQGGKIPLLPDVRAAVIVPGFMTGKDEFLPLARSLTDLGIPSVVVPMPNWHWLPCMGARSMRPYLEWIDFTVRHLASAAGEVGTLELENVMKKADLRTGLDPKQQTGAQSVVPTKDPQLVIPDVGYSMIDCYHDLRSNPGLPPMGGFPLPENEPTGKVALIGHSAGGWICRAYLSDRKYNGKAYSGHKLVHSLITLGSPHGNAPGPCEWVSKDIEWVNRESSGVRALAVGGTGYMGGSSGKLTQHSYGLCCNERTDGVSYNGDGVTPIHSALAMKEYVPHADTMVLEDVGHFCWSDVFGGAQVAPELTQWHKEGRPWYGDDQVVEKWAQWL